MAQKRGKDRVEFAAIPKGRAELRVGAQMQGKRRVLDIRVWYRPRHFKDHEPMVRTRKGVTIDMDKAGAIAAAILRAVESEAAPTAPTGVQ